MVKLAVAGATTGIGRAIIDGLSAHGGHEYVTLSRTSSADHRSIGVDYTDIDGIVALLEAKEIHTVISTLAINNDASGIAQLNLIEAANRSKCTQRFIPSEFGVLYRPENILHVPAYEYKLRAAEMLKETNLEYSLVSIGFFLDYWAAPRIPTSLSSTPAVWIDMANNFASIPGDGSASIALTHSRDVGQMIPLMLDLLHWHRRYFIVGSRLTLNEVVCIAEKTKGVRFEVYHDTIEQLERGYTTLTPQIAESIKDLPEAYESTTMATLAGSGLSYARGYMDLDLSQERTLNVEFPFVKLLTVEAIALAWRDDVKV